VLDLPSSVTPQTVHFLGPDQQTFKHAYSQQSDRIAIWSGSAFVRYHHQFDDAVQQLGPDHYMLNSPSVPPGLSLEHATLEHSTITWVFPHDFEVVNYTQTDKEIGHWQVDGQSLTYRQIGPHSVLLSIEYRRTAPESAPTIDLCASGAAKVDDCATDDDTDGIPDYRDVCLASTTRDVSNFGCESSAPLVLKGINFASGFSYLNVEARQILDRLAYALQHEPTRYFEVSAHTDSEGKASRNKQLSQKRAAAVRHYLLLRGVDPNQVRAAGYGESYPISDNADETGRRKNRRIELTSLE